MMWAQGFSYCPGPDRLSGLRAGKREIRYNCYEIRIRSGERTFPRKFKRRMRKSLIGNSCPVLGDFLRPRRFLYPGGYESSENTDIPRMHSGGTSSGPARSCQVHIHDRNRGRHIFPGRLSLQLNTSSVRSKISPTADMGPTLIYYF